MSRSDQNFAHAMACAKIMTWWMIRETNKAEGTSQDFDYELMIYLWGWGCVVTGTDLSYHIQHMILSHTAHTAVMWSDNSLGISAFLTDLSYLTICGGKL